MICRNHVDVAEGVRRCARCGGTFCADCLVDIQGRPFCAVCKTEQLLDVRSGIDRMGPVRYAGMLKRIAAYLVDYGVTYVIMMMFMLPLMFAVGLMGGKNPQQLSPLFFLIYIPALAVPILYEGLMLQYKKGQTLGKLALQVRVVRPDGSPISSGQAWGRTVMRIILGCGIIIDYIPAFFTDEKTTLHDLVANTRVVEIS